MRAPFFCPLKIESNRRPANRQNVEMGEPGQGARRYKADRLCGIDEAGTSLPRS